MKYICIWLLKAYKATLSRVKGKLADLRRVAAFTAWRRLKLTAFSRAAGLPQSACLNAALRAEASTPCPSISKETLNGVYELPGNRCRNHRTMGIFRKDLRVSCRKSKIPRLSAGWSKGCSTRWGITAGPWCFYRNTQNHYFAAGFLAAFFHEEKRKNDVRACADYGKAGQGLRQRQKQAQSGKAEALQKHGYNMLSGCLPMIVTMTIFLSCSAVSINVPLTSTSRFTASLACTTPIRFLPSCQSTRRNTKASAMTFCFRENRRQSRITRRGWAVRALRKALSTRK